MVSNESGFGADMAQLGGTIADGAHEVGEYLGFVDGPLIPGDPAQVRTAAEHATKLAGAFERAGQGFKTIDDGGWYGQAAEAFHSYLDTAAPKWFRAADAFTSAGAALNTYADTLSWAKKQAAQGKKQLEAAQARSEAAAEQHKAAQQQAQAGNAPPPPPFADPAAEDKAAAQHSIDAAKKAVVSAGREAARAVRAARQDAPAEPGMMAKVVDVGGDVVGGYLDWQKNVWQGALGAVGGLYQQFRMVNPLDPYNVTHPQQALSNLSTTAAGVVSAIADPWQAAKTVVNVDGWKNNPAQTAGSFGPTVLASLAGGSGVAARVAGTAGKLGRAAGKVADNVPSGTPKAPSGRPPASPSPHGPPPGPRPTAGGGQPPGGGPPNINGQAPSGGQPNVGTPWGDSDLPPAPSHGGMPGHTPEIPDYSRPDGSFGPQGSSQPDIAEPPSPSTGNGQPAAKPPWLLDDTDAPEEVPSRDLAAEQDQPWRPSHDPPPSMTGERDVVEAPSQQVPAGPDARPEMHEAPGPDTALTENFDDWRAGGKTDEEILAEQAEWDRMDPQTGEVQPNWEILTDREVVELSNYRGSSYAEMNEALRTGDQDVIDKLEPRMQEIDSALEKMPAHEGTVYRGLHIAPSQIDEFLNRYEPGQVVTEEAFTSTSRSTQGATPGNVELVIDSESGRDIAKSPKESEAEVLIPRGTDFEVTDRFYNPSTGKLRIFMKEASQGGQ